MHVSHRLWPPRGAEGADFGRRGRPGRENHASPVRRSTRQLYASVWHQDRTWRFYRTASFVGGDMVDARRIALNPSCMSGGGLVTCSFTEVVTAPITAEQWAGAKVSGLDIRLNGQQGPSVVVKITPAYIAGFDAALGAK